jgi:hypothetical protein
MQEAIAQLKKSCGKKDPYAAAREYVANWPSDNKDAALAVIKKLEDQDRANSHGNKQGVGTTQSNGPTVSGASQDSKTLAPNVVKSAEQASHDQTSAVKPGADASHCTGNVSFQQVWQSVNQNNRNMDNQPTPSRDAGRGL